MTAVAIGVKIFSRARIIFKALKDRKHSGFVDRQQVL